MKTAFLKPFKNEPVSAITSIFNKVRFDSLNQKSLKCSYLLMQQTTPRYLFRRLVIGLCKGVCATALFIIKISETLKYSTEGWLNKLYIHVSV